MANVTVKFGVNKLEKADYVGMTVQEVRDEVSDVLNIPADAQARINGVAAAPEHAIAAGSTVEFVKIAGEKGAN